MAGAEYSASYPQGSVVGEDRATLFGTFACCRNVRLAVFPAKLPPQQGIR